jgi:hypothetical protein
LVEYQPLLNIKTTNIQNFKMYQMQFYHTLYKKLLQTKEKAKRVHPYLLQGRGNTLLTN